MVLYAVQAVAPLHNSAAVAAAAACDTVVGAAAELYGPTLWLLTARPYVVPEMRPVQAGMMVAPMETARGLAVRVPKDEPGRGLAARFLQHLPGMCQAH